MADYRELLRKAIDALPENTGANRRAVYEKARTALVSQLRSIEPPLPAREITTHRLALEDCIREVEHEATEKLLGRFRAMDEQPQEEPQAPNEAEPDFGAETLEPEAEQRFEPTFDEPQDTPEASEETAVPEVDTPEPTIAGDMQGEPYEPVAEGEDDQLAQQARWDEERSDSGADWNRDGGDPFAVADDRVDLEREDQDDRFEAMPVEPEEPETTESAADAAQDVIAEQIAAAEAGGRNETWSHAPEGIAELADAPDQDQAGDAQEDRAEAAGTADPYAPGSIEDIIASAEQATIVPPEPDVSAPETAAPEAEDRRVIPFITPRRGNQPGQGEDKHFLLTETEAQPASDMPLVDVHGRPLGGSAIETAPGTAMSSVREVDLEPGILNRPEISDAQVAIDRAIAALDAEARGEAKPADDAAPETEGDPEKNAEGAPADPQPTGPGGGGFGALTIFLVISVLLLGGGGVAGYWAWREGYVDLNAVFAQGQTQEPTQVAETEIPEDGETPGAIDPADEVASEIPAAANTTPDVPAPGGDAGGATVPGDETPSTETVTPSADAAELEATFEDRLPAEADAPASPSETMLEEPNIAAAGEGAQSLLLEEQQGGATGAVPYSGSVEWSRGTDELGNPTIIAEASIPARNLDVEVLLRRNADANLPASHLMEVSFDVAETFVGGSIANLPGVLLKDEELIQGQPLTGASARIVGNSFLFALSSASEIDVENNVALLSERGWLDLAMVYGTGRRAIMTLEKGEEGQAIFDDVLTAWAELDAEAAGAAAGEDDPAAGGGGAADAPAATEPAA